MTAIKLPRDNLIQLPSGDAIAETDLFEGMLLLARATADFPVITDADRKLAVLILMLALLDFNDEAEVI